jgi:transcriptional regulator with XRE-family HTH domain
MFVTVARFASTSQKNGAPGAARAPRQVQHCLRALRTQRGLTRREVCECTGLSVSTLRAVEKQEREVSLATAFKLAHFYGLPVTEIWRPLFQQICREMTGVES